MFDYLIPSKETYITNFDNQPSSSKVQTILQNQNLPRREQYSTEYYEPTYLSESLTPDSVEIFCFNCNFYGENELLGLECGHYACFDCSDLIATNWICFECEQESESYYSSYSYEFEEEDGCYNCGFEDDGILLPLDCGHFTCKLCAIMVEDSWNCFDCEDERQVEYELPIPTTSQYNRQQIEIQNSLHIPCKKFQFHFGVIPYCPDGDNCKYYHYAFGRSYRFGLNFYLCKEFIRVIPALLDDLEDNSDFVPKSFIKNLFRNGIPNYDKVLEAVDNACGYY